jgi:hypothetical protein
MWMSGYESIRELEASRHALATDIGWLEFLDKEAGPAYLADPGVTMQRIWRRIA